MFQIISFHNQFLLFLFFYKVEEAAVSSIIELATAFLYLFIYCNTQESPLHHRRKAGQYYNHTVHGFRMNYILS